MADISQGSFGDSRDDRGYSGRPGVHTEQVRVKVLNTGFGQNAKCFITLGDGDERVLYCPVSGYVVHEFAAALLGRVDTFVMERERVERLLLTIKVAERRYELGYLQAAIVASARAREWKCAKQRGVEVEVQAPVR